MSNSFFLILLNFFLAQEIFVDELKIISESLIIGLRHFFPYGMVIRLQTKLKTLNHDENINKNAVESNPPSTSSNPLTIINSVESTKNSSRDTHHLLDILKNHADGHMFLKNDVELTEKSRTVLNSIIINHFIQAGKRLTTSHADIISDEIVRKFPGEIKVCKL